MTVNGSLPVNATRIYRRVERLMNTSAPAPDVLVERTNQTLSVGLGPSPVRRALGFANATGSAGECGAFASAFAGGGEVTISPVNPMTGENLSASAVELVLAHEYAHIVQHRVEGFRNATAVDSLHVSQAISEGSAVFVADAYADRYDERWSGKRPMAVRECLYERTRGMRKLLSGDYYYGGRYFDHRIDSPSALSTAFETAPNTTEQVIHAETPASEPAAPLSVAIEESATWERQPSAGVFGFPGGELTLRTWLAEGLAPGRVDAAATGWGNASVATVENETGNVSVAWTLRWDAPAEADEFEAALADLEPTLENRTGTHLRHVRVAPETVVLFAGTESFVNSATASGTNGNVTVTVPGPAPDDEAGTPSDGDDAGTPAGGDGSGSGSGGESTTPAAGTDG